MDVAAHAQLLRFISYPVFIEPPQYLQTTCSTYLFIIRWFSDREGLYYPLLSSFWPFHSNSTLGILPGLRFVQNGKHCSGINLDILWSLNFGFFAFIPFALSLWSSIPQAMFSSRMTFFPLQFFKGVYARALQGNAAALNARKFGRAVQPLISQALKIIKK